MRVATLSYLLFLSLAYCDPCPGGYTQADNGDCYQSIDFYNSFATQYFPTSFNEAESACNGKSGGMLASIHSKEDNDAAYFTHSCGSGGTKNIGLRCEGTACKWDDGSPLTYRNFKGDGPSDDGRSRCYSFSSQAPPGTWAEKTCGQQDADCWVCQVKARKIDCKAGEAAYKGGCVSIHTEPLDQLSAEAACSGGGHLVSIHSTAGSRSENSFYKQLALDAGVNGTIHIGGQFTKGVFEWIDGSRYNDAYWAKSFPNIYYGSCVQMLLSSEFGSQGQWTNTECSVKQPYICFRDGENYLLTTPTPIAKADAQCPPTQYFNGSGTFYSPNYPLSIPMQQPCEYIIETEKDTKAAIRFPSYDCTWGTIISLYQKYDFSDDWSLFKTISPVNGALNPAYEKWFSHVAYSNTMKVVFSIDDANAPPIGTGWEAEFTGLALEDAKCPQPFTFQPSGHFIMDIHSPNYPLSIPADQSCVYLLETNDDTLAHVEFTSFDCESGTSLVIYDHFMGNQPVLNFTSEPPVIGDVYVLSSNKFKVVFTAGSEPIGKGWAFKFFGFLERNSTIIPP